MILIENDEKIVSGIIKKDEKAFELMVDTYGSLIKSIVNYHLSSFKFCQDECINDILLSVWKSINRYDRSKNSLKNWIGAICKYKCIDYKRKYYNEICFEELDVNMPDNKTEFDNVLNDETESLLQGLIPRDRELFYRHYILGEKVEQIAKQTDNNVAVLYNRLTRGRKKLRDILLQRSGFYEK